tara:strand:- start:8164 stop:8862 length:699 start_codon:yes stop_codon:yes gene_type:complete
MSKDRLLWLVLIALGVGLGVFVVHLALSDPGAVSDGDGGRSLVHNVALLAILVASAVLFRRLKPGHILKRLTIWVAIGAVLVLAYSFRHDASDLANRLMAEVMPSRGMVMDGEVSFREHRGRHFIIDADVDGVTVQFLVDTGASDVTLAPRDARRLGFDLDRLTYDRTYRTANGIVKGAPVRLHSLKVGHIVLSDVKASVNSVDMNRSLLGMSFLSRLSSFEVADGTLTLRP